MNPKESKTKTIGTTGHKEFSISSPKGVKEIIVQYDNDKIISLRLEYNDYTFSEIVGSTTDGHTRHYFNINVSELESFKYRDSGYGHGSLRSFEIALASGAKFSAGPDGYDNQLSPNVSGSYLLGFYGTTNNDGFIQSFGLIISARVVRAKIFDLKYHLDRKTVSKPESLTVSTVVNDQTGMKAGENNTVVRREKLKRRRTNDWSSAFTNAHSTSISVAGGPPELSLSHMSTDSNSETETKGGSVSETTEEEYTVTVNGIPGQRTECHILKTTSKIRVPFSGKMKLLYSDNTTLEDDLSGDFEAMEETYNAKFISGTGAFTPVVQTKEQMVEN